MSKFTYTCPSCHRVIKISQPQTTCLYCDADLSKKPAPAPIVADEPTPEPAIEKPARESRR